VNVVNTCTYDAVLAVLMHLPAGSAAIRAFIDSRKEQDRGLRELDAVHALFWRGFVPEVGRAP
jgi:hypothetical protein